MNQAAGADGHDRGVIRLLRDVAVADYLEQAGGSAGFADLVRQTFSPAELDALSQRGDSLEGRVARMLAKRLVCEVLNDQRSQPTVSGSPVSGDPVAEHEVEILTSPSGRPIVSGPRIPAALSSRLHVSMSHDGGMAAAMVVHDRDQPDAAKSEIPGSRPGSTV